MEIPAKQEKRRASSSEPEPHPELKPLSALSPTRAEGPTERKVCDHCRDRRIRCDGLSPCTPCVRASLTCKREHVAKKRGPKRGRGRVIDRLRAREQQERKKTCRESSAEFDIKQEDECASSASPLALPRPETCPPDYRYLIPQCVNLYYDYIYPIMPVLYMPAIRVMTRAPETMQPAEKNLIYALCTLTCFHMLGQNIPVSGPKSWETAGRFFLDECLSMRKSYDFLEDRPLYAVISSFWLSTSFFEINKGGQSWLFLQEALTLALDMGLHKDASYTGLPPEERLCRQRVFWQLFVTERSFAILRQKTIRFKTTPSLPAMRHPYESPDIQYGFAQLIASYHPLDEAFVLSWNKCWEKNQDPYANGWNEPDRHVSSNTFLALQEYLSQPPAFMDNQKRADAVFSNNQASPEPTIIQKADLLITQQWLRLVVWQSCFRQGLIRSSAARESMDLSYPLSIAKHTAAILDSLPPSAVEVHGLGIFEKIFNIAYEFVSVMGIFDSAARSGTPLGGAGIERLGMDFAGSAPGAGALSPSRTSVTVDPVGFFVSKLSVTQTSRTKFADTLLKLVSEKPGALKCSLGQTLPTPTRSPVDQVRNRRLSHAVASETAGRAVWDVMEEDADEQREVSSYPPGAPLPRPLQAPAQRQPLHVPQPLQQAQLQVTQQLQLPHLPQQSVLPTRTQLPVHVHAQPRVSQQELLLLPRLVREGLPRIPPPIRSRSLCDLDTLMSMVNSDNTAPLISPLGTSHPPIPSSAFPASQIMSDLASPISPRMSDWGGGTSVHGSHMGHMSFQSSPSITSGSAAGPMALDGGNLGMAASVTPATPSSAQPRPFLILPPPFFSSPVANASEQRPHGPFGTS